MSSPRKRSRKNSPRLKFPERFYDYFVYLEDEDPYAIHQLLLDDEAVANCFQKAHKVSFRSRAFQPPRNRIPRTKSDVEMSIDWDVFDEDEEVITFEHVSEEGLINIFSLEEMQNLAQGSMPIDSDVLEWKACVWRPKLDAKLTSSIVTKIIDALKEDGRCFVFSEKQLWLTQ